MNPLLRISKTLLPWVLFFVLLFFTIKVVEAQGVLGGTAERSWDMYLRDVVGFSPNNGTGEELAINFVLNLIRIVRNLIGALALVMGTIYGLKLVISQGKEEAISKQKTNFLWVLVGFVILILSESIARIFNPESATSVALVDFDAARDQVRDVVGYLKWLLGSIIALLMAVSSIRMITAGGDEEVITKQRKNLVWSGLGMLTILLASNVVNAIYVINSPNEVVAAGVDKGITELTGIIRLILVFLGPMTIAFTIYAGIMYLTSLDSEDRVKKSKTMIAAGVVGIVTVYAAFAIVNTIAKGDLTLITSYFA